MVNRDKFFSIIKASLFGSFNQAQVDGLNSIIEGCITRKVYDLRKVAYILATTYHETAKTMKPIPEYGKGKGYDYGKKLKMSRKPYDLPHLYYGRGYVQLTWYENYDNMGKILGVDLLNNPDLALDKEIAAFILIEGMNRGSFTGKKLDGYFNNTTTDWTSARKIVNGMDKADLIAGYAIKFYRALTEQN